MRSARSFTRTDFRVVHISLQHDHIHLLVEAESREALADGMRTLNNVMAHFINDAVSRRTGHKRTGTVFADRYHEEVIRTPTQARNALRYVVNNWRKHSAPRGRTWLIDPFSTGAVFEGWAERSDAPPHARDVQALAGLVRTHVAVARGLAPSRARSRSTTSGARDR